MVHVREGLLKSLESQASPLNRCASSLRCSSGDDILPSSKNHVGEKTPAAKSQSLKAPVADLKAHGYLLRLAFVRCLRTSSAPCADLNHSGAKVRFDTPS